MEVLLKPFEFCGYANAVGQILSAFGIVGTTISKIQTRIDSGDSGPLYVYRRAAIFCSDDDNDDALIGAVKMGIPLIIILHPTTLTVFNNTGNRRISVPYHDISELTELLSPLQSCDLTCNDRYKTLELDKLVSSLYRELKLSDNQENIIHKFIFSILYISHFNTFLEDTSSENIIKAYNIENDNKLDKIYSIYKGWKIPAISNLRNELTISKEAYKYIFAILRFDTSLVDAEMLTSLIYKMAALEEAGLYGHQTDFENVAKLLQPLFLNSMQKRAKSSTMENVFGVVQDIYDTVVFDPTNGPGCFLVSAYIGLTQQIRDIETKFDIKCDRPLDLQNFVGLVSNELCLELTKLALIFTHIKELRSKNLLTKQNLEASFDSLNINQGNELIDNWGNYVSPNENLYIVGSPEFRGYNKLPVTSKSAMHKVYKSTSLNGADYSSAWLIKAAQFIGNTEAKAGFVLTNSVSQGAQATFILNTINSYNVEYIFAHRSFKWKTSSHDNTGVTVVIIGIGNIDSDKTKVLFDGINAVICEHIGPTLLPDIDIRIKKRNEPLSKLLPHMRKGNMPDGAVPLTFSSNEIEDFLTEFPKAEKFLRPLYGGDEFVSGVPRWVLWISDEDLEEAQGIKGVADRIELVRQNRTKPSSTSSEKSRQNPHKFRETFCSQPGNITLVVPCVTSEHRQYFQIGILDYNAIVNNNVNVIFDSPIWLLALLESKMHLVWALNSAGGHETRPRYSSGLCYHTFPIPEFTSKQIGILTNLSKTLLEVREKYCDKSLAELYNGLSPELLRVHKWIDETVDSFYRSQPFEDDTERLIWLKNLYNNMLKNE